MEAKPFSTPIKFWWTGTEQMFIALKMKTENSSTVSQKAIQMLKEILLTDEIDELFITFIYKLKKSALW